MIELRLLDTVELVRAGESSEALLVQPRRLALLAYLAASKGAFQRRDKLLLLFWGEQPEARARASLRQALYFIRRTLGDDVLATRGDGEIGLNPAAITTDVTELHLAIAEGRDEDAMRLYRGDFLADFNIGDAPEFERWAAEQRREIRRTIADVAWRLADRGLQTGARSAAIRWAQRAFDLAEYSEGDTRRAMRLLSEAGDRSLAIDLYERFRQRLADELDTVPEPETASLAETLRVSGPEFAPATPVIAAPVTSHASASTIQIARESSGGDVKATRRWWPAIPLAAALLIAAILFYRNAAATPRDAAMDNRVAVLPFTVRSGSDRAGYLREGAATLLGLGLDGAGRLHIVDPNAVLIAVPASPSLEEGRRIASSLGAGQFVLGEIEEAGTRLHITATLYDETGKLQSRASAVGDEAHVFDLVDTLARTLAVGAMNDSTGRLGGVAATSTRSLAAFKAFLGGEVAMRAGHYREAVTQMQSAVAADSTFGLAWYRLSLAREWTDGEISSDSAAVLAEHFAAHLPDRDRKLLAARRAFIRRDMAEGERLAGDVVANYPTDADAWAQLGEVRFHLGPNVGRSIDESRGPFLTVLRYRPNDLSARVHLTRIAARAGDATHLDEWTGRDTWLVDASEVGAFELASMRAVVLHDQRARDTVMAASRRVSERTLSAALWRLMVYTGDPDGVAQLGLLRASGRSLETSETADVELMRGHIAQVRLRDSLVEVYRASVIGLMLAMPSSPPLPVPARNAHAELVRLAAARGPGASNAALAAAIVEARFPELASGGPRAVAFTSGEARTLDAIVRAMAAVNTEPSRVAQILAPSQLDEPTVMSAYLYDLIASLQAESRHKLGKDAEAIAWLTSIGVNSPGSSAAVPLATRRRAELEDAMGSHEAATRDRQRFSSMWQAADADLLPLVAAARAGH